MPSEEAIDEFESFRSQLLQQFPAVRVKKIRSAADNVDNPSFSLLPTPAAFYAKILQLVRQAKKRIFISTLYIGSGEAEGELLKEIRNALSQRAVKVTVVLDAARMQRLQSQGTAQQLKTLALEFPVLFQLVFSSPHGKDWLPGRIREMLGVYHAKVYASDETICLTGANLSAEYFDGRIDRYLVVGQAGWLVDWYSSRLVGNGSNGNSIVDTEKANHHQSWPPVLFDCGNTLLFPLLQKFPAHREEEQFLQWLLPRQWKSSLLVSAYLNPPPWLSIAPETKIITASSECNGWSGAKPLSVGSLVPKIYAALAQGVMKRERPANELLLYSNPTSVFHSKGFYGQGQGNLTVATWGSSNFNYRSLRRDVEGQLVVVTRDPVLSRAIKGEFDEILASSRPSRGIRASSRPSNGIIVRVLSRVFRSFL